MNPKMTAGDTTTLHAEGKTAWSELSQFRLTLSDLFIFVAFCAGLSLVCSRSWSLPGTTLLAISMSMVIGFFFVISGLGKRSPAIMLVWLFLTGIVLGCGGSIALFWVSAAHAIAAIVLCFVPRNFRTPRLLVRTSMVMIVFGLIYWTNEKPYFLEQLIEARNDYPIEDISARLNFAHLRAEAGSTVANNQAPELAAGVESRLQASEVAVQTRTNHFRRSEELERIHGEEYERFVRRSGFGILRMRPAGLGVETPELPNINVASAITEEKNHEWDRYLYGYDEPSATNLSQVNDLLKLHFASEYDFLNPNMFGYVAEAKPGKVHAAGFIPHAFHGELEVEKTSELESLQMKKLQLVSLLKFANPKAYVLDHLPRMDQLSEEDIRTRALTRFELDALGQLRLEKDVVIEQNEDVILMMGALRAGNHCLKCHAGSRGDLLGAFSYEFSIAD